MFSGHLIITLACEEEYEVAFLTTSTKTHFEGLWTECMWFPHNSNEVTTIFVVEKDGKFRKHCLKWKNATGLRFDSGSLWKEHVYLEFSQIFLYRVKVHHR